MNNGKTCHECTPGKCRMEAIADEVTQNTVNSIFNRVNDQVTPYSCEFI
jgi:hypothetical protein